MLRSRGRASRSSSMRSSKSAEATFPKSISTLQSGNLPHSTLVEVTAVLSLGRPIRSTMSLAIIV